MRGILPTWKYSKEKRLEAEIKSGKRSQKVYAKLAHDLGYASILKLTKEAIKHENVSAILGLAQASQYAVADAVSNEQGVKFFVKQLDKGLAAAPELFFRLRTNLSPKYRSIYRRLARTLILRSSLNISGKGLRGEIYKKTEYFPGLDEFDIEETLEKYMESGLSSTLTYKDIVGLTRHERKKVGILIFDTSGSMYGKKMVNAALTIAVLAYHMRNDDYGIVLFNTEAETIKKLKESISIDDLVDKILESQPAGYTNIEDALRKGLQELKKVPRKRKWAILVTDGDYNRGGDPRPLARSFPQLHVIQLPHAEKPTFAPDRGDHVCKDLARIGKGRYAHVHKHEDIPKVLMKMLKRLG